MSRILTINCGSTSTKVAFFEDDRELRPDLAGRPAGRARRRCRRCSTRPPTAPARCASSSPPTAWTRPAPTSSSPAAGTIHHVSRGRRLRRQRAHGGHRCTTRRAAQHASALSCLIGKELVAGTDIPVIIYDPTCVDSRRRDRQGHRHPRDREHARLPPAQPRRRWATSTPRRSASATTDLNLVIAHLGGGITHGLPRPWPRRRLDLRRRRPDVAATCRRHPHPLPHRLHLHSGMRTSEMRMYLAGGPASPPTSAPRTCATSRR